MCHFLKPVLETRIDALACVEQQKNGRQYVHLVLVQSVDKCTACLLPDTPDGFSHRNMWEVLAGNGRHLLSIAVSQVAFNQSDQQTTTREDSW